MYFLCRWIVQPLVLSNNRTNQLRRAGGTKVTYLCVNNKDV